MIAYNITFARSALKDLERLDKGIARRVVDRIEKLAQDPRPSGCVKLSGPNDLWRIRMADYRVVYSISDANRIVDISIVRHRKDVYR